jgi:protein gp37
MFKQWGDWAPVAQTLRPGESSIGNRVRNGMIRVGKKRAGRALDGRTWDEYPR